MTLRTRLTAAFLAVVLVPMLVGTALLSSVLPRAFADGQAREVETAGRLVAAVLAERCEQATALAEAVGRAVVVPDPAMRQASVQSFVARGLVEGVRVEIPGEPGITAGRVAAGEPSCVSGRTASGDSAQLSAAVRLQDPTGAAVGRALVGMSAGQPLAVSLRDAIGRGEVALLADGEVVAASGPVPPQLVRRAVTADGDVVHANGRVAVVVPPRVGQPLGLLVVEPEARGVAILPLAVATVIGAVLLAAAIALLLARATTRPLEELVEASARVASGDLETTLDVRSRDEVGRLARAFNAMTVDLRRHVGALQRSRDELQSGLTRLGETLSSTHDLDGILTVVLETAIAATTAQAGAVLLVERPARPGEQDWLRLAVGRGLAGRGAEEDIRLRVGVGIAGRVAQDDEPVRGWIGDGLPSGPGEPHAESVLAVPLRSSGSVVGVLALYDRPGGFDDADLRTIHTFASQATVAIDNVQLHDEAQRQSLTDDLTGLGNHRHLTVTLTKEIERAARFGRPMTLLMLDLDHFKDVNDAYGHARGDAVLVEVAARLHDEVRDVDTLARYGGEEIVAVLPETDVEGAAQAAERLRATIAERPFLAAGQPPVSVTVSVGAAVFPGHGTSSDALMRAADAALYAAKRGGRDAWRLAAPVPGAADSDPSGTPH